MANISAILLAAVESTRMGRLKALLDWQGKTLLEWQIQTMTDAGAAEVIVVLGHSAHELAPYVKGQRVISVVNSQYRKGKTTSIKAGLTSVDTKTEGVLLLAVDQPRPLDIIKNVIREHADARALITAPRHNGHGGHPVAFHTSLKSELEAISEENMGIREVMSRHESEIHWVDFDTPIVRLDINTPQAYEEAKRLFSQS